MSEFHERRLISAVSPLLKFLSRGLVRKERAIISRFDRVADTIAAMRPRWPGLLIAIFIVGAVVVLIEKRPPTPPATRQAVSQPATSQPTTLAVTAAPVQPKTLFALLRREQPAIAATQPLGIPVDFGDAGRFVVAHPIHLDDAGQLWITLADAEPTETVVQAIARAAGPGDSTHLVRDEVRFVFWMNVAGKIQPAVFVRRKGALTVVTAKQTLALPVQRAFHFDRALAMADTVAVPCDDGVSLLQIGDVITEQFQPLPASSDPLAQPQVIQGVRGLLAWSPATAAKPGSGVMRFLDNAWSPLDAQAWPTSVVQLSPYLDGTVQQLLQSEDGKMTIARSAPIDTPAIDEKHVADLIDQLGDPSSAARERATGELQRIGPAAWPIMHKLFDNQDPETQHRLTILLAAADTPALGSMVPVDGKLRAIARYDDAGVLLYAEQGVTVPQPEGAEPATISPAWICVRPGRSPELLADLLTADLQPGGDALQSIGDEWYRISPTVGPQRFIGNALVPMLHTSERQFSQPIGADRRGRWLFRQPGRTIPTLLIDPTIQDPTPRLPVWTIRVKDGSVGWTKEGWPAIKRGGGWELRESGWKALDEEKNPMITTMPPPAGASAPVADEHGPATVTPAPANGASGGAGAATTTPDSSATRPTDFGSPLLTDDDGKTFFDGKLSLNVSSQKGSPLNWTLPATATGVDPVTLIKSRDGKLFLFNQPGRVIRLSAMPGDGEPFKIDATFSRNIPNGDCARIWLDPAGRICMVCDGVLAVLFPDGVIPHEIAVKMSADELKANEPE